VSPHSGWFASTQFQAVTELVRPDVLLIRVCGDLDLDSSDAIAARLATELEDPLRLVLVELSGVTFCSSAGLNAVLLAAREAAARSIDLYLVGAGRVVRRPLDVTGLDRHFRLADTVEEALGI
jgi:anti-sigma B factor antagonist